jgi:phenylalanyl-tRNA synthetase alpha chain
VLAFYLLHEPVVVAVAYVVLSWRLAAGVQYLLISGVSLAVTVLLCGLVRRGRVTIQLLVDAAVARLAAWGCQVRRHRGPRVVPVEDNYDRLRIGPDAVTRDVRYTRYVDGRRLLRSHSTAMVPAALRALAADPVADALIVCPGMVYRRDAIDRLHAPTPHQLDLWRVARRPLGPDDLGEMARLLVGALTPGRPTGRNHACTPTPWTDARWTSAGTASGSRCGSAGWPTRRCSRRPGWPAGAAWPWAWAWTGC